MNRAFGKAFHAWILGFALIGPLASPAALAQSEAGRLNDRTITELVRSALSNERALRRMHISVRTVGRVVYLRGYVDSLSQIALAGAIARGIEGVSAVSNAIRIADRPNRARLVRPQERSSS